MASKLWSGEMVEHHGPHYDQAGGAAGRLDRRAYELDQTHFAESVIARL
jgi:hypothetical protein